jgi:DNA-binding transcriptional LysR family regulator
MIARRPSPHHIPEGISMNRFTTMEAFVHVFETGSFSSAARRLRVGQPAVSKMIAQLEDRLGVRLVVRSTHGLTLTEAGQRFYERAKRSLDEADEADLAARGAAATLAGRLRISAAVTFAQLHVVPRLPVFLEAHPELEVEVVLDDRNIDLIEEGIDVGLRMGALPDSTMTAKKIAQARRLVLGSAAYLAKAGEPKVPADLGAHQSVIYDRGSGGSVWTFRKGKIETSVTVKGRVRVTAAEGVRAAVFAGLGLTIASEWMFAPELRVGTVRPVLRDWELPPIDLWALFPTGRRASAKARTFASFIEKQLSHAARY